MGRRILLIVVLLLAGVAGLLLWLDRDRIPDSEPAIALWSPDDTLTDAEIEAGRHDESWRDAIELSVPSWEELGLDTLAIPETWGDIGEMVALASSLDDVHLPLGGQVEGPSVLYVQVLLDRSRFSPGVVDGKWGKNTEKAVFWFQHREGLPPTGVVDSTTYAILRERSGEPTSAVVEHILSEADVEGPFMAVPADVYRAARLPCMCYESLAEKLGERFHASRAVLEELNPGVALDSLAAGDPIQVPALAGAPEDSAAIARLVVNGRGFYVHALDADGRILWHFPTTLGTRYDPSPAGSHRIVSIHLDPWFHYQPRLLAGVDPSKPETHLPPGPNNLVGDVWIKLSAPHYGIHGTRDPESIGYVTSSGCIRLTNWDARALAGRVTPGTSVDFEDTREEAPPALEGPAGG
ncbi:MAG TPA: L,D-transpeptidase family protein [Gemmatimonadota bacterium]|nr:L,D-transpeptidase family protein [Gemmatimonadota bacterium]